MNAKDYLTKHYENYDEDRRLTSKQHSAVEYITTMKYVERYLRPGMRIIEIGAATGRYSHALAQMGYKVDAVELVEHNIEVFKQRTLPGESVTITQGNAIDLSAFESDAYDITLLLGPMYHLFTEEDQKKALSEAIRVTKKGGIIFAAYCNNDATIIRFCFQNGGLRNEHYKALVDPVTFKAASNPEDIFVLHRKEDIDALMAHFPVKRLHYLGTDMVTHFIENSIDAMDDEFFELYLKYHLSICEREDMVGVTNHMLDIFRKE